MTTSLVGYKRLLCLMSFVVHVVCAIDADTTPSGSPTLTTDYSDGGNCTDPWKRHYNSCYILMTDQTNFTEANKSCSDKGAYLVSISDDAENEFIMSLGSSTEQAWIGLNRQITSCDDLASCDWMWLDGSQLGYYNWPPDSSPSSSKCANIEPNGLWGNGRICSANLEFICEGEVWYPTTTLEVTMMRITADTADPSSTNSKMDGTPAVEPNKIDDDDDDDDDDMAIIIGCVVGGLVLVAIVTVVVVVLLKRQRTSSQADQPVEDKEEETPPVAKHVRYNPGYEDVDSVETQGETNVTFKPSPDNADTGAHGVGDNPHNIYSEAIKKKDRPGSKGILVKENTLYGTGK